MRSCVRAFVAFRRQCIESAVHNGQKRQVVALSHVSGRQEGYLDTAGFREQAIAGPSRARALTLSTRWRRFLSSYSSLSPPSSTVHQHHLTHHPTPPTTHAPPPPATLEISFALRARVMRG